MNQNKSNNHNHSKIHRPLVDAVSQIVHKIMFENRYADKAIEHTFKTNPKWGARDRAFIAESTYEIIRWWRKIASECGVYEISDIHLKKIVTRYFKSKLGMLPDWENTWDFVQAKQKPTSFNPKAIEHSVPDWIFEKGVEELGAQQWEQELIAMNQQAPVCLRMNLHKASEESIIAELENQNIHLEPHPYYRDIPILSRKSNVFSTQAFKNGWIEIQDAGSQQIPIFMNAKKGSRIIDACAGAGGKTLQLASLLENSGKILALDTEDWKLAELRSRAKRAGISNVETRLIESSKTIKRLEDSADYLLLDVPCSGLGVLKRNPDTKWKLKPEFLEQVKETQSAIIHQYARLVRKGGELVYATCSLLPSENQDQIQKFLKSKEGEEFEFLEDQTLYPSTHLTDGFYMCKLRRK